MDCAIIQMRTDDMENPDLIYHTAPVFSWKLESSVPGQKQTSYHLEVARNNDFSSLVFKDSQESDVSHGIPYRGEKLEEATKYYWRVCITDKNNREIMSPVATFVTGLHDGGFKGAEWICVDRDACDPDGGLATFRKQFSVQNKTIASARLYSTALGVYDVFIDGNRVGHRTGDGKTVFDELKPGVADNDKRVYYLANDVTRLITLSKEHVLTASVSSGWWNGTVAYDKRKTENAFLSKLMIDYQDGTRETFTTDTSWKAEFCGPVMEADIFNGETYDANADISYRQTGFDDLKWHNAAVCTEFCGEISPHIGIPVRAREDLKRCARSITVYEGVSKSGRLAHGTINVVAFYDGNQTIRLKKGQTAIYDLGQNFSGVDEIELCGPKHTVVTLRHSEMLNDGNGLISRGNDGPEGSLYVRNLRGAKAKAVYILCGAKRERYTPRHTYFGYRYVEVTATADITLFSLAGIVLTSVISDTGSISTSNEKVNRLFRNIKWSQYSNYLSIPTDCPQRAERQGWTADTQVFSTAACYNADSKLFLEKWLAALRDSQADNGAYPNTAPANFDGYGVFGWADAGVIVPYRLYKMYADVGILADHYASMKTFMDAYMQQTGKNGGLHVFGDWLSFEETDMNLLSVAYYAQDAQMMSEMAAVLGRTEDAEKYRDLFASEKEYFISLYTDDTGGLIHPTQTACLYALKLGLFSGEQSKSAIKRQLLDCIAKKGNRLQTGFLGTAILLQTLSLVGATDVAYALLLQTEMPSWLYPVEQGATTIWERWDAYTKENGFGDPKIDDASFNHYAYGAVAEWMYSYMAGIRYDDRTAGFKRFILSPHPDPAIGRMDCSFESNYGRIVSSWRYSQNTITYEMTVPANTSATVYLPDDGANCMTVNGKPPARLSLAADGIEFIKADDGRLVFRALAGSFRFTAG